MTSTGLFEAALDRLDSDKNDIHTLYNIMNSMAVPVILYHKDESIRWANKCMVGMFFGLNIDTASRMDMEDIYNKPLTDIFPEYLHSYVIEKNREVMASGRAQLEEDWSDEEWVDVVWDVIRWPVGEDGDVCALLLPKDQGTLQRCQTIANH